MWLQYYLQAQALIGLRDFCKNLGFGKPIIVNSGRGIHAYWALREVIGYNEWKPVAEGLKKLCAANNLHADPAVTSDAARILRVPGTLNFKNPDEPYSVEISSFSEPYLFEDFKDKVGPEFLLAAPTTKRTLDAATQALLGNYVSKFSTIMIKSKEGKGCAQLSHIYENQAEIPEPLWRSALSIAKFCADGDEAIHRISAKHPDYSPQFTEEKAAGIPKPHTCAEFEKNNPNGCEGCPNKGRIKTPIQLGSEIAAATAQDNIVVIKHEALGHEITVEIPTYPFPYFRGKNGGVYKKGVPSPDSEEDSEDTLVYENDLYVVKRLEDPELGEVIWMKLHLPRDGVREFAVPLTSALTKDKLRDIIAAKGVAALGKQMDMIMAYITRWVKELQNVSNAEKSRLQFGWSQDKSFVIGDREIKVGEISYSPPSSATINLVPAYCPHSNLNGLFNAP
jgi:hypothetical protein